jgi:S1-C subfamily serine protease
VQDVATQTQRKTKRASGTAKRAKATANKAGSGGLKKTVEQLQGIAPAGAKLATSLPVKTAVSRLAGKPVSRTRAFMAASAAAATGAAVTYRLLRSGDQ